MPATRHLTLQKLPVQAHNLSGWVSLIPYKGERTRFFLLPPSILFLCVSRPGALSPVCCDLSATLI